MGLASRPNPITKIPVSDTTTAVPLRVTLESGVVFPWTSPPWIWPSVKDRPSAVAAVVINRHTTHKMPDLYFKATIPARHPLHSYSLGTDASALIWSFYYPSVLWPQSRHL